jgi:hypothetical protein
MKMETICDEEEGILFTNKIRSREFKKKERRRKINGSNEFV